MPLGWLAAAATIGSGLLGANASENAAETNANAQTEAARIAAEAAKPRPATATTGFGTGNVTVGADGSLASSYTLDPRLAGIRDILYGAGTSLMPSAGTQQFYGDVQNQAQQQALSALGMSPEQAAAKEYSSILDLMNPQRQREQASLAQNLFKTGRMGAGVSYGNGAGYINPQQYAYVKALEEQNQGIALNSLDRARAKQKQDIQDYFNLAGQAPNALVAQYGLGSGLFSQGVGFEQLGQSAADVANTLSGRATVASANAAALLGQGIRGAAGYQAAGSQAWPQAISSAIGTLGQRPITGTDPNTGQYTYGQSPASQFGNWVSGLFSSGSPGYTPSTSVVDNGGYSGSAYQGLPGW